MLHGSLRRAKRGGSYNFKSRRPEISTGTKISYNIFSAVERHIECLQEIRGGFNKI